MIPERLGPEEQSKLARLAADVESDLRLVGMPVISGGNCFDGLSVSSGGALVFFDPSRGESGGVYVSWRSSPDLMRIAVSPSGIESRVLSLGGAALESMTNALERILSAGGWRVDSVNVGVHESSIRVFPSLSA
jgi:hypothetical protein